MSLLIAETGVKDPLCSIDGDRLWKSIMEMAEFGSLPGGGCDRPALTDSDRQARDLFVEWSREAGCAIRVDGFGNIFAVRAARRPEAPVVMIGSHLDTQPHGGRFDGVYGVMAGLEVVRSLNDHRIETDAPVVVVNWTNEEGVRFAPGLTGSKGFARLASPAALLNIAAKDGMSFACELARIGYRGDMCSDSVKIAAYLEPHIEQGPLLERARKPVGVVTGIQGVRWFKVTVAGADRHAGTTSMDARRDSFMATALMSAAMRQAAIETASDIRFTIGSVDVAPGSPNTVPGKTVFVIDLRHRLRHILDEVADEIRGIATEIAQAEGCDCAVELVMDVEPVNFDETIVGVIADAARDLGLPFDYLASGAMHDASSIAQIAPTAMLFVPCRDGISHAEDEWAEPSDLAAGCAVVAKAAIRLATAKL